MHRVCLWQKSLLSFPNEKIKSSFRSVGISDEFNLVKGIDNIKGLEYQRFLEKPQLEYENMEINTIEAEGMSDIDTDFEMDHQAIKSLNGDVAGGTLGMDGSLFIDFKPPPRVQKSNSSRKKRAKTKLKDINFHLR
jgi:hypothetical protein